MSVKNQYKIGTDEDKQSALQAVENKLKGFSIPKKSHNHILMLTEILIDRVIELNDNKSIALTVTSGLGEKIIKLTSDKELPENLDAYCTNDIVSFSTDFLSVKNNRGKGSLSISVKGSASYTLLKTLITVALALILGCLVNYLQWEELSDIIQTYFTLTIEALFINALQMVAVPVTFFAIICSTSFFYSYLREGVLGKKLFFCYIISAAFSVILGGILLFVIQPSLEPGYLSEYVVDTSDASLSFPEFITSLIPTNIMDPFVYGNSAQLLILAIIIGIAVGALRHKQTFIGNLIDSINNIFIKVLNIIFVFSPYALFFAVFGTIIGDDGHDLGLVVVTFLAILIGLIVLVLIRCIILAINHINPLWFIKNYKPFFAPVIITGSTIECIPENIKNCHNNFKLPNKYLKQSVPFCAHNNMDGNCLFLGVVCSTIAYSCNLDINLALLGILIIFAIILSAGAPNQPGSGIICMAVLIPAMGVSTILLLYVVLLDLICETLIACTNNFSDMATITCIAKKDGLLKI